jgi:hypothetical protein
MCLRVTSCFAVTLVTEYVLNVTETKRQNLGTLNASNQPQAKKKVTQISIAIFLYGHTTIYIHVVC